MNDREKTAIRLLVEYRHEARKLGWGCDSLDAAATKVIDAADDAGGYTEFNWNRDGHPDAKMSRERAIERVPEFVAEVGLPAGLPVEVASPASPDFHPIYSVAKTAIDQMGGACLADDAAAAAAILLLRHWEDAIPNWGGDGPSGPEVERMILGDIRDCIDQMEALLRTVERRED